ncbi:MAG: hypothetical protein Q7R81_04435 [Candidatus Peregrinibacteria bacterium]|nr:hypothetical protein [Candidatus Peregrinibacteria bacterium]
MFVLVLTGCAQSSSTIDRQQQTSPAVAGPEWVEYRSPSHGYALWYPSNWILEDADDPAGARIHIDAPDSGGVFIVSALGDKRITEPGGVQAVFTDIRDGFEKDERYSLEAYEDGEEKGGAVAGNYIARGGFTDAGTEYRFKELGTLMRDGRIFVTTAHVQRSSTAQYGEIFDEMIGGFDPFGVGGEQPLITLE